MLHSVDSEKILGKKKERKDAWDSRMKYGGL